MPRDESDTRDRILRRLDEAQVQNALADVFTSYLDDLHDVLNLATVENNGVRPEGLANEVFSCFHHLARGLSQEEDDTSLEQFHTARGSHLKRAILDSYKIALNSILTEDAKLREVLDYIVLAEDFAQYIPDGLQKINEIKDKARLVKREYRSAKKAEARGNFDEAMGTFNTALEYAGELQKQIAVFTQDKTYLLACSRETQRKQEKHKDRRIVVIAAVVSAVLTAALTLGIPALWKKDSNPQNPTAVGETRSGKGDPIAPLSGKSAPPAGSIPK